MYEILLEKYPAISRKELTEALSELCRNVYRTNCDSIYMLAIVNMLANGDLSSIPYNNMYTVYKVNDDITDYINNLSEWIYLCTDNYVVHLAIADLLVNGDCLINVVFPYLNAPTISKVNNTIKIVDNGGSIETTDFKIYVNGSNSYTISSNETTFHLDNLLEDFRGGNFEIYVYAYNSNYGTTSSPSNILNIRYGYIDSPNISIEGDTLVIVDGNHDVNIDSYIIYVNGYIFTSTNKNTYNLSAIKDDLGEGVYEIKVKSRNNTYSITSSLSNSATYNATVQRYLNLNLINNSDDDFGSLFIRNSDGDVVEELIIDLFTGDTHDETIDITELFIDDSDSTRYYIPLNKNVVIDDITANNVDIIYDYEYNEENPTLVISRYSSGTVEIVFNSPTITFDFINNGTGDIVNLTVKDYAGDTIGFIPINCREEESVIVDFNLNNIDFSESYDNRGYIRIREYWNVDISNAKNVSRTWSWDENPDEETLIISKNSSGKIYITANDA